MGGLGGHSIGGDGNTTSNTRLWKVYATFWDSEKRIEIESVTGGDPVDLKRVRAFRVRVTAFQMLKHLGQSKGPVF